MLGFPAPILIFEVLAAFTHVLYSRTGFGKYIYAIGGNENAAQVSGIGTIPGTIVGTLIIGVLNNSLDLVNVSAYAEGAKTPQERPGRRCPAKPRVSPSDDPMRPAGPKHYRSSAAALPARSARMFRSTTLSPFRWKRERTAFSIVSGLTGSR
jgi:hypothetical protein